MAKEHNIQDQIRLALSPYAVMFRQNVGSGYTFDGRYFSTGVPKGFSDLFGFRKSDGKAIFIEVKNENGKLSKEQRDFLLTVKSCGAIAGVCRSSADALKLIGVDENV